MLHYQYALVEIDQRHFGLVEVERSVFSSLPRKVAAVGALRKVLPSNLAIILFCTSFNNDTLFYGDLKAIAILKKIELNHLTWHQITL